MALGLLDGLRRAGASVPRDIAEAGFDDIGFVEISNPRLPTVHQPAADMGAMAVRELLWAIKTRALRPSTNIPVRLVIRESTRRRG